MWIRLKNIQVYAYHGVYDYEREHGTRFEIDVELNAALDTAVKSDVLADTIDYVIVQKEVTAITTSNRYRLVETLADRIAGALLAKFPVREVIVRVRKPGAALGVILDSVEISAEKQRAKMNEGLSSVSTRAFIGLGSNLEPRLEYLKAAMNGLRSLGKIIRISSVYETAPVGGIPQPHFLNAVLELQTALRADRTYLAPQGPGANSRKERTPTLV